MKPSASFVRVSRAAGRSLAWMAAMACSSRSLREIRLASSAERWEGGVVQRGQVQVKLQFLWRRAWRVSEGSWSGMSGGFSLGG
ncbi:hypothetical protein IMZ48_34185 [Candidatus Bathyarchaeota archaeon]|nr:hypothetical protein [Candidatus Bathyarchaeota archaeon]